MDTTHVSSQFQMLLAAVAGNSRRRSSKGVVPLPIGSMIGPFRIVRVLGSGGMGVVYACACSRTGVHVAVKVLTRTGVHMHDLFRREARCLRRMHHPGVVRVLEVGQSLDEGRVWYAMELIEGDSLRRTWDHTQATLQDVLDMALHLSVAVCSVHAHGVVHGDLKPENILVRVSTGLPVVVDFGLAEEFAVSESGELRTRESMAWLARYAGTPRYMAPEQRDGESGSVHADMYSLGTLFSWLVLGEDARGSTVYEERSMGFESEEERGRVSELMALAARMCDENASRRPRSLHGVIAYLRELGGRCRWSVPQESHLVRARFVGRSESLKTFEAWLDREDESVFWVKGRLGIGKTRFAMEAVQYAAQKGWDVVWGRGDGGSEHPLALWRGILDQCSVLMRERCVLPWSSPTSPILMHYTAEAFQSVLAQPHSHPVVHGFHVEDQIAQALMHLFEDLCVGGNRLFIAIDDVCAGDALSLRVLRKVAVRTSGNSKGVRFLCTFREGGLGEDGVLGSWVCEARHTEVLEVLGGSEVGEMVSSMLVWDGAPEVLTHQLFVASEGLPLFVTEMLSEWIRNGVLKRNREGGWSVRDVGVVDVAPKGVETIFQQRLRGVSRDAMRLAQQASILGREWDVALLVECFGVGGEEEGGALGELIEAGIVENLSGSSYAFRHRVWLDVLRKTFSSQDRLDAHRCVAEVVSRDVGMWGLSTRSLAGHWLRGGCNERAFQAYRKAVDDALRVGDLNEASICLRRALDIGSVSDHELFELACIWYDEVLWDVWSMEDAGALIRALQARPSKTAVCKALMALLQARCCLEKQDRQQSLVWVDRARTHAQELPQRLRARCVLQRVLTLRALERTQEAVQYAESALHNALSQGHEQDAVALSLLLAKCAADANENDKALKHIQTALHHASSSNAHQHSQALIRLAHHLAFTTHIDQARGLLAQAHPLLEEVQDPNLWRSYHTTMSLCADGEAKFKEAYQHKLRALDMALWTGDQAQIAQSHNLLGYACYVLSRFREAKKHFERAKATQDPSDLRFRSFILTGQAMVAFRLNECGEALAWIDEAIEIRLKFDMVRHAMFSLGVKMSYCTRHHRFKEAQEAYDRARALSAEVDLSFATDYAELLFRQGRLQEAVSHLEPRVHLGDDPSVLLRAYCLRAILARALGEDCAVWLEHVARVEESHHNPSFDWLWVELQEDLKKT